MMDRSNLFAVGQDAAGQPIERGCVILKARVEKAFYYSLQERITWSQYQVLVCERGFPSEPQRISMLKVRDLDTNVVTNVHPMDCIVIRRDQLRISDSYEFMTGL